MSKPSGSYLDPHREEIEAALGKGATMTAVARALKVPRSTVEGAVQMWERPSREERGEAELEALRKLAESL